MSKLRALLVLSLLALFTTQCGPLPDTVTINIVAPTQVDLNQAVQSTFQALTAQAPKKPSATPSPAAAATATATATTGSIAGQLRYPADSLPAMYVTAYQAGSQKYQYVITSPGQNTYEIDGLEPGTYHVIAYTIGGGGFPVGLAGGYTQAVPCGLGANCTDHSLLDVQVEAGQVASGIVPDDWYAAQGTFQPFPQMQAASATATLPAAAADGGISGTLMYPASGIPALRIVAFQVGGSAYYHVDTNLGQSNYELDHLPPGTYHVVAYPLPGGGFTGGPPGGYSQMVPCGLQAGCTDHTLIDVVVTSGNVTAGVNPNDYYANPGSFPPNPVP
jgi:hypothetical protein